MGAKISWETENKAPEETGFLSCESSKGALKALHVAPEEIPFMIDEIPLLVLLCTQATGTSCIEGVSELKFKESNRITSTLNNLKKMGAQIKEENDKLFIQGASPLNGALLDSYSDHRIAMMCAVAAWTAKSPSRLQNPHCVNISYPGFWDCAKNLIQQGKMIQ